jgi:hypothetical protein
MQCRTTCAADAAAGGGVTAAQAYLLRGGRRLVAGGGPGAELRRPRWLATLTQPFATRRGSRRAPSMIKSAHGQSRRANFVSSLRKDCCREVDTCTTSRRAPCDPAHQRGSLDVQPVFRRVRRPSKTTDVVRRGFGLRWHRTLSISCGKAFRSCWISRQTPSAVATGCVR